MHIFPAKDMRIITASFASEYKVKCLDTVEIFGSKINALLTRAAARDLYDVYNMIQSELFDDQAYKLLRKCVVFYAAISAKVINKNLDSIAIENITKYKIRTELNPVITKRDLFDLGSAKKIVKDFISKLMLLTPKEHEFLSRFENKEYLPELIFDDKEILDRIKKHPMALWKIQE